MELERDSFSDNQSGLKKSISRRPFSHIAFVYSGKTKDKLELG
jgi:hypothetical protein